MSITRSQIARQLMAEGGAPRQGYFFGKLVKKFKDDIIPNELKTDLGKAATAAALGYGFNKYGIPGTSGIGTTGENIGKGSISNIFKGVGNIFTGGRTPAGTTGGPIDKETGDIFVNPNDEFGIDGDVYGTSGSKYGNRQDDDRGFLAKTADFLTKKRLGTDKSIAGLLMTPQALAIGSGLLAGAFTKDEDDPTFTGQDVGLNLRDIRRLANISDPATGSAIGLNFLPDIEARKFTPAQMASLYESVDPQIFTEQREPAEEGGIMGNQKEFNKFLEEMKKRDYGRMREQILRDYEEFMRRKKMINQRPEVKDGGMIKEAEKYATQKQNEFLKNVDINNIPRTGNLQREQERAYENAYREYMERNTKADGGMMEQFKMASAPDPASERNDMLEEMSLKYYKKPLKELSPDQFFDLEEALDNMSMKPMPKGRTMAAGGGLMNLGGMEMDLRGGGFVPIGAKEKADDVPARLSKNEFVFTADAVRAAGGGSVDKGADKMYATMKALEDRVA